MLDLGVAATMASWLVAQPIQLVCAERNSILSSLSRQYSEAPTGMGISNNGVLLELLTAHDGKTWTLLLTRPDGTSCVLAAGEGWQSLPQIAGGQPL
jgi:phage/plasmid primase-like uncharacterized protein